MTLCVQCLGKWCFDDLHSVNFIDEIPSQICDAICLSFLPQVFAILDIGIYCYRFSSENNDEKNVTAAKNRILASSCSESGKYLALCDDLKQLHLYKYDEQWKFLNLRYVPVSILCNFCFCFFSLFFTYCHILNCV